MVGYWCRVGSLALTHTRTDIFGAVAIWDQRRTMLNGSTATGSVPLILALGSAPSGSGGPSSAVGLTSLPIVNSHAESAAMLGVIVREGVSCCVQSSGDDPSSQ